MWWHWTVWVDWLELDTTGFLICFTLASSTAAEHTTDKGKLGDYHGKHLQIHFVYFSYFLTGFPPQLCIWHFGNSLKDTAQKFCCKDMHYLSCKWDIIASTWVQYFQHFLKLLFFSETVFISLFIMIYFTQIMRIHETVSSSLNISLTMNFQHKQTKLIHDGLWKC